MKKTIALFMMGILAVIANGRAGQNGAATPDPAEDTYIDVLRADLRADKTALITEAMQFSEKDAAAFWPIYKRYDAEVVKLNDERVQLIKVYSATWTTMSDADAKNLAKKALDLEGRRADLKRRYFVEFDKALPGLTVAKFFQLEHRLDLMVDLKIASELPALLVRSSGSPAKPN